METTCENFSEGYILFYVKKKISARDLLQRWCRCDAQQQSASASLRMMLILFISNDLFCPLTFSAAVIV